MSHQNNVEMDTLSKLNFLSNDFDILINNIEEIIVFMDKKGKWKLTEEDINRIYSDTEANKLFKKFMPIMLSHYLLY